MQLLLLRCPFKPYTAAETTVAETLMALLLILKKSTIKYSVFMQYLQQRIIST